jgi:hypothetical protein
MKTVLLILLFALSMAVIPVSSAVSGEALGAADFKKLYDSLLAGKTLVNETAEDGTVVKKERHYGAAVSTGDGDFDIPVKIVITYTINGKLDRTISVQILDRVNDIGGHAIIQEEITGMSVQEAGDEKPEDAAGVEFGGVYRVGTNDKGGFDVHNFALSPSLKIDGDSVKLAGSMVSFSCYSQTDKSVCELNVRDFDLGVYEPYQGFKIGEPIGGDFTEVFVSE